MKKAVSSFRSWGINFVLSGALLLSAKRASGSTLYLIFPEEKPMVGDKNCSRNTYLVLADGTTGIVTED
jgi:hypothetical protein